MESSKPPELERVFKIFKKHYVLVPLEIFGSDPFKTLVSTLMSARTNDNTTLEASKRLFAIAPNFKTISKLDLKTLEKIIYPVGFYRTKAKHLKSLSEKVLKDYNGRVPSSREELMSLPGVGRKTANLVLNRAFKIPAIAVDTHVHRITNMLGWVKTKSAQQTEQGLMNILPKKYWPDTNRIFVSIGRQYASKKNLQAFLNRNSLLP